MSALFDDEKPEAYHWRMNTETRIQKLEADDISHTVEIALLKGTFATKIDIADVKILLANLENRFSETIVEIKADFKTHAGLLKPRLQPSAVQKYMNCSSVFPLYAKFFIVMG